MPSFRGFADSDFQLFSERKARSKDFNSARLDFKRKLTLLGDDLSMLLRKEGIVLPYTVRPNWIDPNYRPRIDSMWLSFSDFKRRDARPRMLPQLEVEVERDGVNVALYINEKARKYQRRFVNYIIAHTSEFGSMFVDLITHKEAEFFLPDRETTLHELGSPLSDLTSLNIARSFQIGETWLVMGYFFSRSSRVLRTPQFASLAAHMLEGLYPFFRICHKGPDKVPNTGSVDKAHTPTGPPPDDKEPPKTQKYELIRKIRDNEKSKSLKFKYQYVCQVCRRIIGGLGEGYAEVHHLRPLGGHHRGLDNWNNMLVLCPNHHAEFDYGWAAVDSNGMKFLHVVEGNRYYGKRLKFMEDHRISVHNCRYHLRNIYKG